MENPTEKLYNYCPTCASKLVRKNIDERNLLTCLKCGFIYWSNPKPVASVLIEKDNKILMLRRNKEPLKGYWVLPGGFINYDETPQDAAVREAKEETNLDIDIIGLIGVYQIDNDPRGVHLDIIYYGKIIKGNICINEESSEYNLFSFEDLPELTAYKHLNAIEDWKKDSKYSRL